MKVPDSILRQAKDVSLPVTVRIGKSGVTDALIVELDGQLSSRTLVKAKVNRGLFERNDLIGVIEIERQRIATERCIADALGRARVVLSGWSIDAEESK